MPRTWQLVACGVAVAGAAALVSILVLHDDGPSRREKAQAAARSAAAEMERAHAQEMAKANVEAKIHKAQEAALAAAEFARAAAEKEKQEARAKAIEEARTQGILGTLSAQQGGAFASITGTGDISSGFDDLDIQGGLLGNDPDDTNGGFGFGRSGFGPGGGGTGSGTIGLGTYGTLGHGSGTGQGYGVGGGRGGLRGRTASTPSLRYGAQQVVGELDGAIVRRYVRRSNARLRYCYEKQLLVEPSLSGTVTVRFEIGTDGAVTSSEGTGVNEEVASCMATVLRATQFPKPTSGTVSVTLPLALVRAP